MGKREKIIQTVFESKEQQYAREVKNRTLFKGTLIMSTAPITMLAVLVIFGKLKLIYAFYGGAFVFVLSIIFARPYIANLSALTNYVRALTNNKKGSPPDLTFLNNVEEMAEAIEDLHNHWEMKNNQLEANIAELKILIDSLPDVMIMLDKNYKIIRTNSTAKAVFGGKFFDQTMEKIVKDPEVKNLTEKVMKSKQTTGIEFILSEPYNRHYILRASKFPIYSPGGISLIIIMHDITEQKHTEQLLSDFVANASHEIRTPLTSVMGLIETLQTSAAEDPKATKEFLKVMQNQTDRMAKLVKDLLSLSQIERNIHNRLTEKVSISKILKNVKEHMEMPAEDKQMEIELNVKGKLPKVYGDISELTRIFENLIGNAIKYGHKETSIKIDAEVIDNIYLDDPILREADKLMKISVSDCSNGIPPEHLPRLTERFYRVDSARSRKIGGTGLGLSIVKHILEHHHGILKVDSTVNKGSTFSVFLPVE